MPPTPSPSCTDAPVVIGVDIGSTSIKAIAFDIHGRKVAAASRPTPMIRTETGGEYHPDAIFETATAVLAEVGKILGGRPAAGIAATSIGESCVLVDAQGRALVPSIAWFDRRTGHQADAIVRRIDQERIFAITGIGVEFIFTLTKLLWMRAHWPDAIARAQRVLMMADWIAYRLSGVAATDPTLASRTLYYDIRGHRWSDQLLALAGLAADFPAPLMPCGAPLGPVRPEILAATGLAGAPLVAVGGHDHIVGAIASGLNRPGTVVDSVGTAEGVILATTAPLRSLETTRRGYVQGAIEPGRVYCLAGSLFSSGGAMDWVRSVTGGTDQAALAGAAAKVPPGSHGVIFLPHLANGPPPKPDEKARGAFLGLSAATGPADLYRAVVEGVAMQARMMLDGMASLPGVRPPQELRLTGGVTRNRLFVEIKAAVFGRRLILVDEPEFDGARGGDSRRHRRRPLSRSRHGVGRTRPERGGGRAGAGTGPPL